MSTSGPGLDLTLPLPSRVLQWLPRPPGPRRTGRAPARSTRHPARPDRPSGSTGASLCVVTTCRAVECKRDGVKRGLCHKHYQRERAGRPLADPSPARCEAPTCDRPARSSRAAYCEMHYCRLRRNGSLERVAQQVNSGRCVQCDAATSLRFCGSRCRARHGRGLDEQEERSCLRCGVTFSMGTSRRDRFYCSRACQQANRHAPMTARQVALRDGIRCHLCSRDVDLLLSWPHPGSGTVDHVQPVILGGANVPENLALAHARCNLSKGPRASVARRLLAAT